NVRSATRALHPSGRELDGLVDLQVAGAAAEIAGERLFYFSARWARPAREQRLRGEEDAGRAVAALRGAELGERLLQRMQRAALRHPPNSLDPPPSALRTQRETREHGLAIDEHRAHAALAELAPVLRAGEREILAQHLKERLVGRERHLGGLAVHGERHR